MRTVWLIERAASPSYRPQWLAEGDEEVLLWTSDLTIALRFTERHLANRFAHNRMTEAVCVVDKVEDSPTGWVAPNIALRHRRDDIDAARNRIAMAAAGAR